MKVAEIREELKKRKDLIDGLKAVLLDRLKEALIKESHVHRQSTTTTAKNSISANNNTGVYIISEYSWWKVIKTSTVVEEPKNPTFKLLRAPTVEGEETKYLPQKFDFAEKFDRPVFEVRVKRKLQCTNGSIKKNRYWTPIFEEVVQDSGCIDP